MIPEFQTKNEFIGKGGIFNSLQRGHKVENFLEYFRFNALGFLAKIIVLTKHHNLCLPNCLVIILSPSQAQNKAPDTSCERSVCYCSPCCTAFLFILQRSFQFPSFLIKTCYSFHQHRKEFGTQYTGCFYKD